MTRRERCKMNDLSDLLRAISSVNHLFFSPSENVHSSRARFVIFRVKPFISHATSVLCFSRKFL